MTSPVLNASTSELNIDASQIGDSGMTSRLFEPLQVGNMRLQHRVAMSPLSRYRAKPRSRIPTPLMKEYYTQRASVPGTLITAEGIIISHWMGGGSLGAPGIWSSEQLYAFGRTVSAANAKEDGVEVVGASPVVIKGNDVVPRAMTQQEIGQVVQDFEQAARNAISAGFDAVEIHGANGYIIDQFLNDRANVRTDSYGGSVENRTRLLAEMLQAVTSAIGPEKVGLRLSPWSNYQDMGIKDPVPQFSSAVRAAKAYNIAYLSLIEARVSGPEDCPCIGHHTLDFAFNIWPKEKSIFLAGAYTPESARAMTDRWRKDHNVVILFGKIALSNPDFVFRTRNGLTLNHYDRPTFFTDGAEGYVDYPFSKEFLVVQKQEA